MRPIKLSTRGVQMGGSINVKEGSVEAASVNALATRSSSGFYVRVRPQAFRLCWIIIVLLYTLCAMFFGLSAWLYWKLPSMSMGFPFEIYRITVELRYLFVPALCYTGVALAHSYCLLQLLFYCAWHRRLTFDVRWIQAGGERTRVSRVFDRAKSIALSSRFSQVLQRVFGRRGIFGVEGEYFELVYIAREVLETVLQTTQAYAMSTLVSRPYLSQLFSIMIFINCWSTPIMLHFLPQDLPLARLSCLLLDIGLDFISTVLVPLALVVPYFQYYDPQATDFKFELWYDDVLLVKLLNEFRLVMINTWPELATRMLFSVGMLSCLENSKSLLRSHHSRAQTHPILVSSPKRDIIKMPLETFPPERKKPNSIHGAKKSYLSFSHRLTHLLHGVLMIWGLAVLITHFQASTRTNLSGCALQVRPWFASKSACALMYVCCKSELNSGTMSHLDDILKQMDEKSLVHIVIRHCSKVEIPVRVRTFPHLVGMKIYNSTLSIWDSDAALTNHHHPNIVFFFLVDVNMTRIPDGLLAVDFPQQLQDIEISGSNLTHLPDILEQRWSTSGVLVMELCSFKVFPIVLSRLKMTNVFIGNNQFTDIPVEMFTSSIFDTLLLSNNPIRELPSKLLANVSAKHIILDNTQLTEIPPWANEAFLKKTALSAVGTFACAQTITDSKTNTLSNSNAAMVRAYKAGRFNCDRVGIISPFYPRYLEIALDEYFANN